MLTITVLRPGSGVPFHVDTTPNLIKLYGSRVRLQRSRPLGCHSVRGLSGCCCLLCSLPVCPFRSDTAGAGRCPLPILPKKSVRLVLMPLRISPSHSCSQSVSAHCRFQSVSALTPDPCVCLPTFLDLGSPPPAAPAGIPDDWIGRRSSLAGRRRGAAWGVLQESDFQVQVMLWGLAGIPGRWEGRGADCGRVGSLGGCEGEEFVFFRPGGRGRVGGW